MKHFSSKGIGKAVGAWRRLLMGAALLALAPTAQAQLFGTAATFSSGAGGAPVGVAVADFNADGRPDVATANNATNTVGVLLGTGSGSLGAATTYGTGAGSAPQWVAATDVNGDGRPDLVTANTGTNQVGVLLNNGNGTFGAVTTYGSGAGSAPLGLALADVNADGNPDIVTANNGSNTIGVLLNAGGGSFGTVVTYATGTGTAPLGVALADLNADGRPDVVTANAGSSTASVLLSSGPGTFGAAVAYGTGASSTPNGVALADLNADGKPDLVTANTGSNTIGTLLNSGTGTFGTATTTSTGAGGSPAAIALADVNADGRPDAVVALSGSNAAGVLLGTGPGTFGTVTAYSAGPGSAPLALTLADLNGDTLPDLVSNNNGSNTVGVLLNQNATATITSFSPTTSRAGGTVTVTGTGLSNATSVTVNGTAGTISGTPTGTSLSFVVGAGSSTGLIRITTGGGSATSSSNLTVIPTPTLVSTTPTVGATGTVLTVTGTDLQNPSAVTFTGVGGTFGAAAGYSANAAGTTLSNVVVPSGLQPGNATFTVSTPGGTTNALSFLVSLPPVITSFAPTSGQAGATITLTGSRLADVTDVTVNGVAAAFTLGTATSLTFTVPTGTGSTQQVVLTSPGGTSVPSTAFTAQLRVTSTNPAPALNTALVTSSALSMTFSEPVTAASAQNLRVFSSQVGGRKAGNVTVSRSTATFRSSLPGSRADFKPGELVEVTVPATITNASGLTVNKKVYQFRTAVGATGTGNFTVASTPSVSPFSSNVCVGDLDGDGDLDMATSGSYSGSVGIRFNDGAGNYSGGQTMTFDGAAGLAMGDLDGDGDLDLAVSQVYQQGSSTLPVGWATILLNNGSGSFSSNGTVSLGTGSAPTLALGDLDGDGDLDLVAPLRLYSELAIRFNNGSGSFSGGQNMSAYYPEHVVLADMDNDGDLDIVQDAGNGGGGSGGVLIAFNNSNGTFATGPAGSTISGGINVSVAVGDMDGDGDLDVATCSYGAPGTACIWKNNGNGTFPSTAASCSALGGYYASDVDLADVDGDGDLDLLGLGSGALSVRLNNGNGIIGGGQTLSLNTSGAETNLTTGDVDGDGDLDVLLENNGAPGAMNVCLNGPSLLPIITSFTPTSGAQGTSVIITGTNFTGATSVSFNGTVATAIANNTATSLTVNVPVGATNGYLNVTTAAGTSAPSSAVFIVVLPPTLTSFTPTSGPVGTSVTITGTNFTGATGVSFNGTAATSFVVNSNTSITATVPAGATTGTISVQAPGGTVTSTGTFTVIQPPMLSGISPGSGPVGVALTLTGTTLTGTTVITFSGSTNNTVTSGFTVNAAGTQITGIIVPSGVQNGPVTVTTPAGTSNGLTFTLTTALAITAVSPTINNHTASLTSPSQITFSLPLAAGSENALQVYSNLRGGKLTRGTTPVVRTGNTLSYTPTQPYQAGEVVSVSVTSAAIATGGETLLRPKVYQFRTGVSTGGAGIFQLGADYSIGTNIQGSTTADVDADGDLDLLVCTSAGVSVRLNNGNGTSFTGTQNLASPNMYCIATGDIDGDGDVDFVASGGGVMVRYNNSGTFSGTQNLATGSTYGLALADVDGDGDLDLLFSNTSLGVSLNDGTGVFGTPQYVAANSFAQGLAVGDLDGDGDIDALVGTGFSPASVYVMTNNGYGTFVRTQAVTVNDYANRVVVADVDGDGDLDFAACSSSTNAGTGATIGLNNGSGNFSTRNVSQSLRSYDVALADVDGDGDADLLTVQASDNSTQLRRNDGTGIFGAAQSIAVGPYPLSVTTADVDGDGDLDLLASNNNNMNAGTVSVRFNIGGTQPGITSISPTIGAVGSTVVITGLNLGTATAVSFTGGVGATIVGSTTNTLTVTVPVGASTGPITVTTPSGTATSPSFTVTSPSLTSVSPTAVALGGTITLFGSGLQGTHTITFGGGATQTSGFAVNGSGTQITGIIVPGGAITGLVTATAGTVTTNGVNLTVYQQPTITSISPTSGPVGTSVTITGTNLTGGTVTVRVNGSTGTTGTITSNTGTMLVFTVRSGSATGPVYVSNGGGTATGPIFTILTPQLAASQGGTSYSNNGTAYNFGSQVVNTTSAPVAFTLTNAGTADLNISSILTSGNYAVSGTVPTIVSAGGSATVSATFTPTLTGTRTGTLTISSSLGTYIVRLTGTGLTGPALTSISPTSGVVGSTVTLNGTNLTGTSTITFGAGATVTSGFTVNAAGTQITGIVVPGSATTGPVTATTGVGTSNGVTFTVTTLQLAITAVSPTVNLRNAARTSPVQVTFNQALAASSAAALKVHGAQHPTGAAAVVSGNTLTFNSPAANPFAPGENVQTTITTAASGSGGSTLSRGRVVQFTAATSAAGAGYFGGGTDLAVGSSGLGVAFADIDGDGDLDFLASYTVGSQIRVFRNNGAGSFTPSGSVAVSTAPTRLVLGDLDNDGDLDLVSANHIYTYGAPGNVDIRFNDGTGTFTGSTSASFVEEVKNLELGDLDADGDLDLAIVTDNLDHSTLSVRFNDGAGSFSGTTDLLLPKNSPSLAVGDVDSDGDLDIVALDVYNISALILTNNGSGAFTLARTTALNLTSGILNDVKLGDVDGDNDLDILMLNRDDKVGVCLNNGSGIFTHTSTMAVDSGPYALAVGDVDGDGDLDVVTANAGPPATPNNTMSVRLNNGSGTFAAPVSNPNPTVDNLPWSIALGDIDGDGDLDVATGNNLRTASIRFNEPTPSPAVLSSLSPASGPVGTSLTITGTSLAGATSVSFNGTTVASSAFTSSSATSIVLNVPAGATSGNVTVTTPVGISNGLPFSVTAPQLALTQGGTSYPSGGIAYNFGTRVVNTTSAAVSFTLSNAGTAPLSISGITTTGNFAVSGTAPTSVAAGGTALVSVTFTPTATGTRTGTLIITSSLGTYTVNLSGTGQVAAPGLSSLSPTSGPVGTSVTISGLNLTGATSVSFGGTTQTTITNNTGSSLTVAVPTGTPPGAVSVTVTTPSGTSAGLTFTVTAPQLAVTQGGTSYPSGGAAYSFGTQVVGSTSAAVSFTLTNAGTATLTISSVVAAGDFALSGPTPSGAAANGGTAALGLTFAPTASGTRTGAVTITSNAGTYTLNLSGTGQAPAPVLTNITPTSALAGSTIALTGTNLTGTYAVSFTQGSTSRSVTSGYAVSSTSITGIVVPASLSPGAYVVYASNLNGVSNGLAFTVLTPAPTIASFSPDHGMEGDLITLTGTNLAGATSVTLGGVSQTTITNNTGTSLTFAVPVGATTSLPTVTTPGGSASSNRFFYVLHDLVISTGTPASPVTIAADDYRNITITGTGAADMRSMDLYGTLTVQNGGYLALNPGASLGTQNGQLVVAAGATLAVRESVGLNFINQSYSFSPQANYIYDGTVAQQTGFNLPTTVRSLTVANPNGVTLSLDVAVTQTLTLNSAGNLALNGRTLTLLSDATGTALVVNSGTGVVTGGTATVQRYLTTTNPGLGYRHYSSPVRGNTLADLQTGTFTPVFNTAYNTSAQPNYVTPFPTVLGYDQARVAGPASTYSGFDKGWYSPATGTNTPANFTMGQGYSVNLLGTEKVDFTGTLNTGTYAVNLARTTGPTAAAGGWALVGNPYPAPIDWTRIAPADRPGLDASIYVYESSSAYGGAYRSYVNGVGSGSPLIGTAQGFWVQVSTGLTAGSLTFRDSHRLTSYATQVPVRRSAADTRPLVQLTLAGNGLADDVFLYGEAGATAAVDASFDAVKLLNPHGLNVATRTATGVVLAIDGRADLTAATTIPLQVGVPAAGRYTFTAATLQRLAPGTTLVLVDALTNARTVLTEGTSYDFITTTTTLPGRFFLNLVPAGALATDAAELAAQVLLYPNPAHGSATLLLPAGFGASSAVVLNALGQTVRSLPAVTGLTTIVDLHGLAAGVYFLRLKAGEHAITKRLLVE